MEQKCRFCLKSFNENEVYFGITEEIKENFESLSQIKFILSTTKKNIICELCVRSLQIATLLKNQFIENQKRFLATNEKFKEEHPLHIKDIAGTSSSSIKTQPSYEKTPQEVLLHNLSLVKVDSIPRIPKIQKIKQDPVNNRPIKIGDKIVLKFEKLDQSSAINTTILGTGNIKTIKKSTRKKRLTAKALELIKQEEEGYQCPFCEETCSNKTSLSTHLMTEHESEVLECNICRRKFFNQKDLSKHTIESHPKDRNQLCTMCPKAYTSKSCLKKHIQTKHPNSKYRCDYNNCLQTFDRFDAIRSHMVAVHPEVKFKEMFSTISKVETI